MSAYRTRTKIELAALAVLFSVASFAVFIGQAGESARNSHRKLECSLCHQPVADIAAEEAVIPDLSRQCVDCHAQRGESGSQLSFHIASAKRCADCHSFHEPNQIKAGETTFSFRFDSRSPQLVVCGSCHGAGENPRMISDGHKRAAAVFHRDYPVFSGLTPSQACLLCHSEGARVASEAADGLVTPQFADHADHPLSVKVVPGAGEPGNRIRFALDSRLKLFDGKLECQTCHSLSSPKEHRLRPFSSFTELCNGCHLVD